MPGNSIAEGDDIESLGWFDALGAVLVCCGTRVPLKKLFLIYTILAQYGKLPLLLLKSSMVILSIVSGPTFTLV